MYSIVNVDENTANSTEQLGSKEKFWFRHEELGRCLFKRPRPNSGEDWSEKIAAELCSLLDLPHAKYELAMSQSGRGVVSPTFVPRNGTLVHGNELLLSSIPDYATGVPNYRVSQHTLELVLNTIDDDDDVMLPFDWNPVAGITRAVEVFVGYILLDALVGNTDRHHENWGLVERSDSASNQTTRHLAPTYDHASSLGRNEPDESIRRRLSNRDRQSTVQTYAQKARSAFYLKPEDAKPLTTYDAFRMAAQRYPSAGKIWLDILAGLARADVARITGGVPRDRMSETAAEFAEQIVYFNQGRLLDLGGSLR
jgi:hypothetical protein